MAARARRGGLALEKGSETERKKGAALQQAMAAADFDRLRDQILKKDGGRLAKKANAPTLKQLGAQADAFLRAYDALETALEDVARHQSDQRIWALNRHGLKLGHALVAAYQDAKAQQGVIDFADAEWLACRLLASEEHAPALALKLDSRYRHLLLDEFQDTNPLQWQALSAWLLEARGADSDMTVFMVGDPKQAIYRFRRGEARVFDAAAGFLAANFGAARFSTDMTRRLAPAVVAAINPVFAGVAGFAAHTHAPENDNRPGALRSLPVQVEKTEAATADGLPHAGTPIHYAASGHVWNRMRNPLTTPQPEADARAVHAEARQFARVLRDEVLGRWGVMDDGSLRATRPGDVMALVRKRIHLHLYERELEAARIPFITSRRGGLLHALEAQDMLALLETLLLPHADLKLAHVLKSPVFGCSDDDLLRVFAPRPPDETRGWERLSTLTGQPNCPPTLHPQGAGRGCPRKGEAAVVKPTSRQQPRSAGADEALKDSDSLSAEAHVESYAPTTTLARAAQLLTRWRAHCGTLPVHGLLDRIYFEGD